MFYWVGHLNSATEQNILTKKGEKINKQKQNSKKKKKIAHEKKNNRKKNLKMDESPAQGNDYSLGDIFI